MFAFASSYSKLLVRKVLKDSLPKDKPAWDFIGRLLVACQQSDVIASDTLFNVSTASLLSPSMYVPMKILFNNEAFFTINRNG